MKDDDKYLAEIRNTAENDLFFFAKLVHPERLYGDIHKKAFKELQNCESPNFLLLLPRSHMKSHIMAVWCEWWITKNPDTHILYLSATTTLAEAQLYAIKNTLTSDIYQFYWPEMIHPEEGKREKWSATAIAVDHPKRKEEGIRDMTIVASGLSTNTTGLHAEVIVADDVVVPDNAYTDEGRRKVAAAMSQMASILNTGGLVRACGTRYHPNDQYALWMDQEVPTYDDSGDYVGKESIWQIMEEVVEKNNVFLWPRGIREDGKAFGFNRKELNRISAMYTDRTQFHAQYYNDPNDPESNRVNADRFQYYDKKYLSQESGNWFFKDKKLNVYAAIDFAYSLTKASDYTAIVVIGIDSESNIYLLDLDRFKTDKIQEYYSRVTKLHAYWGFRKIRAEVTAAQKIIVNDLKDKIRFSGSYIKIDEHRPSRYDGSKEERMRATLEPRYADMKVYHFIGGYTPALEEELILARPKHDDLKDTLASVIGIATPPKDRRNRNITKEKIQYHSRFGGVAF